MFKCEFWVSPKSYIVIAECSARIKHRGRSTCGSSGSTGSTVAGQGRQLPARTLFRMTKKLSRLSSMAPSSPMSRQGTPTHVDALLSLKPSQLFDCNSGNQHNATTRLLHALFCSCEWSSPNCVLIGLHRRSKPSLSVKGSAFYAAHLPQGFTCTQQTPLPSLSLQILSST